MPLIWNTQIVQMLVQEDWKEKSYWAGNTPQKKETHMLWMAITVHLCIWRADVYLENERSCWIPPVSEWMHSTNTVRIPLLSYSFLFCVLLSPNTVLCSITSICPQSPNPSHSGAALTTTASLKKKHDQHYLYKDRQHQPVCPRWLRGTLQNEKSVFSSLISPDRGQESGQTRKTDK